MFSTIGRRHLRGTTAKTASARAALKIRWSRPHDIATRFWKHVEKADGCWNWTGRTDRGYGLILYIPGKLFVCHHCDNRRCVRPDHLFLGTTQDNTRDKVQKGRQPMGEKVPTAKLSDDLVRYIRSPNRTEPIAEIAKRIGVSKTAVKNARCGITWRHVAA